MNVSEKENPLFDENMALTKFKLENEIGKGSYASVKLAVEKNSNIRYALKIY